jgi:restriction system protein
MRLVRNGKRFFLKINLGAFERLCQRILRESSFVKVEVTGKSGDGGIDGMVGRADKGLVITTATFTADARREATRDGAPAIDLVDGDTLCDLLKSLRIGVSVQQVEHIVIDQKAFMDI